MPAALLDATPVADVVEVPARAVVSVDGAGAPESEAFGRSVGAIYGAAYGLKFARKKAGAPTFKVGPLEGRWWAEGIPKDLRGPPPREAWRWRLRLAVPDDVTDAEVWEVLAAAERRRRAPEPGAAPPVRVERIPAATLGRILHVGPYADEPRSFAGIEEVLRTRGLRPARAHLEVYLSDPRRTAPPRLRTVLLRELE
jgi:hypothetical protein